MSFDFESARQKALAAEEARAEARRREAERTLALPPRAAALLRNDFGARRVGYFGSLLRGRLWETSDVDLYVDRIPPEHSYFRAIDVVATLLGRNVHLVELETAQESMRRRIAEDGQEVAPHGD